MARNTGRTSALTLLAAIAVVTAACGGSSKTPLAPSPSIDTNGSGGTAAGAVITGTVQGTGPSALSSATTNHGLTGISISVGGTSLSTAVDPAGRFTLNGVPAGNVLLRFLGSTVDATVTIPGVGPSDTIAIVVTLSGSNARLESEVRNGAAEQEREAEGIIDTLTGSAAAFQFRIGSTVVRGDSTTQFVEDGDRPAAFAALSNGARVEVKGSPRDNTLFATRIHIEAQAGEPNDDHGNDQGNHDGNDDHGNDNGNAANDDHGQQQDEVEAEGVLTALQGTCPALSFTVGGYRVGTTASTTFDAGACSAIKTGDRVTVKGTRQSDGSLVARVVKRD